MLALMQSGADRFVTDCRPGVAGSRQALFPAAVWEGKHWHMDAVSAHCFRTEVSAWNYVLLSGVSGTEEALRTSIDLKGA